MARVIELESRSIRIAAAIAIVGTALVLASTGFADPSQPEIIAGEFVKDAGEGLLAASSASCSTASDCSSTTCDGADYLVDTDGSVSCTDYDGDGGTECTGYDESYAGAAYCGGRYDYNCDASGCDGYKAACEDDCGANTGCDTYSFCSDDSDSDTTSGGSTTSCTDQCQSLAKKCDGSGRIVQCQNTDSDSCTDGFVEITSCDGACSNAQCVTTEPETEPETIPTETTETEPEPEPASLTDRVTQTLQTVWTALTGWL